MSDTHSNFNDGMTEAERHYLATGGDVTDALLTENNGARVPESPAPVTPEQPAPAPAPQPPAAVTPPVAATTGGAEEQDPGDEPSAVPGKPPRRVSYQKFRAAEEARVNLERTLQDRAVANARVEERLALLTQALAEPAPSAQPPKPPRVRPDPAQDIFAHNAYLEEMLQEANERIAQVTGKVTDYEQQIQTGQAEMNEERQYFDTLNQYAGREPNFVQAYNFLLRNRAAELMAPRYPQATYDDLMKAQIPQDVAQMIQQEERGLYKTAFQQRRSPAEDIYRMAQLRGYRAPAAQPAPAPANGAAAPAQPAARPGTPLAPAANGAAPAVNGAAAPTATEIIERIKSGQPAAFSLSNASGGTGIELTPHVLANMPDDQFQAIYDELSARGDKQKLMDLMGH